ncbi:MAG: ABC transporter substrate-binding protein [Acidimicrobiia bacterium]|nr:ABC transporter substrate-binding protein [Acidimicrobiia bacterium]
MTKHIRRLLILLVVLVMVAAACGDDDDGGEADGTTGTTAAPTGTTAADEGPDLELPASCDNEQGVTDDSITITVLTDLSGPISTVGGIEHGQAFKAYFDALNAAGGIDGRTVEVDIRDMKYDPVTAAGEYEQVRTETAMVADILGSAAIDAVAADMEQDCLITFQGATNGVLAQTYTSVFSPATSAGHDVVNGVAYALEQNPDATFAVAYQGDAYGEALKAAGDFAAETEGFEWLEQVTFGPRDTDLTAQTQALLAADPDYVVYGGLPTQLAALSAGVAAAGNDMVFLIPTGAWSPALLGTPAADAIVANVIVITPYAAWGGDEEGVVQMREDIAEHAPDVKPGSPAQTGYNAATVAGAVLQTASESGDLTLGGIYRAAATLELDNGGIVPPHAYGSRAEEPRIPSTETRIWTPSTTAEGGVEPLVEGTVSYDLSQQYVESGA